ncbi:hypothetical protein Taro_008769, partial [Colocasia esculenta]|nr:hypothetical protein [Colocasia esculenta]
RIPPAFIKHIERALEPRKAKILSPLGGTFEVEIEEDIENLCFGAGWQQFVFAHDLDFGYFLVFRYEGRLVFHVRVFDITGCEKEYHAMVGDDENHRKTAKCTKTSSYIAKENIERPITRSLTDKAAKASMRPPPGVKKCSSKDKAGKGSMRSPLKVKKITSMSRVLANTAAPATMIAACGNAPGFKIVVTPSSLTKYVHIPLLFWNENKVVRRKMEVVLRDPEGRLWTVGVVHMPNRTLFRRGWKAFAESNNLKLGDECIFELLPRGRGKLCVFQVHIK